MASCQRVVECCANKLQSDRNWCENAWWEQSGRNLLRDEYPEYDWEWLGRNQLVTGIGHTRTDGMVSDENWFGHELPVLNQTLGWSFRTRTGTLSHKFCLGMKLSRQELVFKLPRVLDFVRCQVCWSLWDTKCVGLCGRRYGNIQDEWYDMHDMMLE